MKIFIYLVIIIFYSQSTFAQNYTIDSIKVNRQELPLSISYFSNFITDPGIKIGIERPLFAFQKSKTTQNGCVRINMYQFFNTLNLGYYFVKEHSHTMFLNTEIGYRKTRKVGFKTEILIGVGYLRTFLTDETYEVDNQGNVDLVKAAGSNYFMPSISLGIGYDNAKKHPNFPLALALKPTLFFQYPYNSKLLTHIGFELNFSYQLNLFHSKSKTIYKSKKKNNETSF